MNDRAAIEHPLLVVERIGRVWIQIPVTVSVTQQETVSIVLDPSSRVGATVEVCSPSDSQEPWRGKGVFVTDVDLQLQDAAPGQDHHPGAAPLHVSRTSRRIEEPPCDIELKPAGRSNWNVASPLNLSAPPVALEGTGEAQP